MRADGEALLGILRQIRQTVGGLPDMLQLHDGSATPWLDATKSAVTRALDLVTTCQQSAVQALEGKYGRGVSSSPNFRQYMAELNVQFPARHVDAAAEVKLCLEELWYWLESSTVLLPTSPAMLLLGPSWIGKTHAICDAAVGRRKRTLYSLVLLGEQFTAGEPWSQIAQLLGLPGTVGRDELLGALDAAGEASGYPCIIFIDALNETQPRNLWYSHLAGMIETIRRYPWLKLCVSCRTTYRNDIIASNVSIPEIEHTGFESVEFDACLGFFGFYGLEPPSVPLMQPEVLCSGIPPIGVQVTPRFWCHPPARGNARAKPGCQPSSGRQKQ